LGKNVKKFQGDFFDSHCLSVMQVGRSLLATFSHLRHPNQLLLIPLTIYSGVEQTAFTAELSQVNSAVSDLLVRVRC